jgi:hypothetical protein
MYFLVNFFRGGKKRTILTLINVYEIIFILVLKKAFFLNINFAYFYKKKIGLKNL